MGKLQSLRRAIEADPKKWIQESWYTGVQRPKRAGFWAGEWRPDWGANGNSYKAFVRHVLKELGHNMDEPARGRQRRCGACGRLYVPRVKR